MVLGNMKKIIFTMATEAIMPYCSELIENQQIYSAKHGYEHQVVQQVHWEDMHPSFSKVWELKRLLSEGFDLVILADADVAFINSGIDIGELVNDSFFCAAYKQTNFDPFPYLCCGLMVWRNTPDAHSFIDKWIELIEGRSMLAHPYEQWHFSTLIREVNWQGIRCCNANEIGCFAPEIWHDGTYWARGMPTVHLAGPADWPRRRRVFLDYYKPLVK